MRHNPTRTTPAVIFITTVCMTMATLAWAEGRTAAAPRYNVISIGTLGGTLSDAGTWVNNRGWAVGGANLPGDTTEHASLWRNGVIIDLGTLSGSISGASAVNESGLITGTAQTFTLDPFGEDWALVFACTPSGGSCQGYQNLVRGFVWKSGVMSALPTLGGNNGFAFAINNLGEVVGTAENAIQDPSCIAPQVFDFEAVIWGPSQGEIRELSPLAGDTIAAATGINDNEQVVGLSGSVCTFSFSAAQHAVLWQNGSITDLGSFGGVMNNYPNAINNKGQIVGQSDLPGDITGHAFLWQNGVMTDLGTLPGDFFSTANAINDGGQVVGQSCDQLGNCRAFLWQDGAMADLNAFTIPGSPLYLLTAKSITSQGVIVGQAFDQSSGEVLGFFATPCDANESGNQGCQAQGEGTRTPVSPTGRSAKVVLPENVRKLFQQQHGFGRFGAWPVRRGTEKKHSAEIDP